MLVFRCLYGTAAGRIPTPGRSIELKGVEFACILLSRNLRSELCAERCPTGNPHISRRMVGKAVKLTDQERRPRTYMY